LPPSLRFDGSTAGAFFSTFRRRYDGPLACEPRHRSWFGEAASGVFEVAGVARVAADPAVVPEASEPGGWDGLVYYRLHGSPRMYYSAYADDALEGVSAQLVRAASAAPTWCIFDNTAEGAATSDALAVLGRTMLADAAQ
jgi:uncharacterized protein YecE (DUF72 family)